jgi:hypothetical protein
LKKLRILIADDHGLLRGAARLQLEQHEKFEVVGEANDGRGAVQMAEQLAPDVSGREAERKIWFGQSAPNRCEFRFYDGNTGASVEFHKE